MLAPADARALVGALPGGAAVRVSSPTYALVHDYATDPPVRHADLYRLDGPEELEAIGFAEMMAEPGINLVEWVDRVPGALPSEWLEIALAVSPGDVRDIRVRAHGTRLQRTLTQEPLP